MSKVNFTESSKCPKCTYYTLFQHNDILIENFTIVRLLLFHIIASNHFKLLNNYENVRQAIDLTSSMT